MSKRSGEVRAACAAALALLLAAIATPADAEEVQYYATVDRERIALDETLTLQVVLVSDQGADLAGLELPEAPDFEVVHSGRAEQTSFSFGSGGSSFRRQRTWTMVLRPLREGELVILPGRVEVGGRRHETGRLTVTVGPARGGQGQARQQRRPPGIPPLPGLEEDPFDALLGGGPQPSESDLFLRATVDREEAWVGEQVTLSIWLFSRVDVSHVEGLELPKLDGFWVEDLESPRQLVARSRVIDGKPYRAYLVQRRALFPLRAGTIELGPASIQVHTGRSFFGRSRLHRRESPGATIEVKELPAGAPAAFRRGNVGQWEARLTAAPTEVAAGEPVTVRLEVEGVGNLQNLALPELGAIDGMKVFDPTTAAEVEVRDGRFGGRRSVEWVLVPERAGTFEIPAIEFAWFDPAAGAYRAQRAGPIAVVVNPGVPDAVAQQGVAPPHPPEERADEGGLEPLREAPVIAPARTPLHERPWFFAALLAPALAAIGVAATPLLRRRSRHRRRRRDPEVRGLEEARALAEARDPAFFASCEKAIHDAAAARLGRPTRGLARSALVDALRGAGVDGAAAAAVGEALERCERGRYAPGLPGEAPIAETLAAAERALAALEGGA